MGTVLCLLLSDLLSMTSMQPATADACVDLQPNWRGILLTRILIQLVHFHLVSADMMCGCLRVAFSRPAVPLSVAEVHAASAFAAGVRVWATIQAAESKQPLETTMVEVMARCTVPLPSLLPKVMSLQ